MALPGTHTKEGEQDVRQTNTQSSWQTNLRSWRVVDCNFRIPGAHRRNTCHIAAMITGNNCFLICSYFIWFYFIFLVSSQRRSLRPCHSSSRDPKLFLLSISSADSCSALLSYIWTYVQGLCSAASGRHTHTTHSLSCIALLMASVWEP